MQKYETAIKKGMNRMDMSWRAAVHKVLSEADEPMHYTDIAQAIIDRGLRSKVGATPAATVAALLSDPPKVSGAVRVDRGMYELRATLRPPQLPLADPTIGADDETTDAQAAQDIETMGLINAFGMYWRRDWVDWSRNSAVRLLGAQQSGSDEVDFGEQAGIYLLHNQSRTVYVGRVTKPRLAARLREHTRDRLNGRWDRFSWFGVRSVLEEGELGELPERGIDVETLIATMEALLIEGLEPPLNRKQGDRFNALEFIQVVDPAMQRGHLLTQMLRFVERES